MFEWLVIYNHISHLNINVYTLIYVKSFKNIIYNAYNFTGGIILRTNW